MLAPTGKATYNIKGNTIHSALAISACQSLRIYKSLDSRRLNTLRCLIGRVKLIFIDEISMVGNTMVNLSIKSGTVPSEWKQAKVVPLFKSGNKDDLDNYRPISILQIPPKILEKAVFQQLHSYSSENSLLSPYQSGFYANHSTQLAITFLTDKIRGHMEKGLLREAVFIDLKKAFDTVPHDGLLNKLFRYGIQDQPLLGLRGISLTGLRACPLKITFHLPLTSVAEYLKVLC